MKKIVLGLMLLAAVAMGRNTAVNLNFEKVKVDTLAFSFGGNPEWTTLSGPKARVNSRGNDFYFRSSGDDTTHIALTLPSDQSYRIRVPQSEGKDDLICIFNADELTLMDKDRVLIRADENGLQIFDEKKSNISVRPSGVQIVDGDDGDVVSVGRSGISVSDSEDTELMTGFWGKLLGNMVIGTINTIFDEVALQNGHEQFIRDLINDSQEQHSHTHFNIEINND